MRLLSIAGIGFVSLLAACGDETRNPIAPCCDGSGAAVRVVNAFTGPVDVVVGNNGATTTIPAGTVDTIASPSGNASVTLRRSGSAGGGSAVVMMWSADEASPLRTLAAVRESDGSVGAAALDDTNSVVPAGATKVRVLHLAPNAGTLQVFRTQPDFAGQVSWQFPFDYQAEPTSISAPFYQSTPGTWEIRVWKTPADASGWANAPLKVVLPLAAGQKRTVMLLDAPGGGVRAVTLE